MKEITRCLICADHPPLRAEPCADCRALYCRAHAEEIAHVCQPFHGAWRAFVGALEDGGTVEYRAVHPIAIPLGESSLHYVPGSRLLTARGVDTVKALIDELSRLAVHSQQAADVAVRVLRLPPLTAVHAEIVLVGQDGAVRSWAGTARNPYARLN